MRLFVALRPPPDVRAALAALTGGIEGARSYVAALTAHADHDAYLAAIDPDRLAAARRTAEEMLPR